MPRSPHHEKRVRNVNGYSKSRVRVDVEVVAPVATITRTFIAVSYVTGVAAIAAAFGVVLSVASPTAPSVQAFAVPDASNSVVLNWTAPGDDGVTGTASQYDIRYSASPITEGNFASATSVTGEPVPLTVGTAQSMMVTGLSPSTTYYFALKTADEVPNWSVLSNIPQKTTGASAPTTCLEDWSCTGWTACAAGGTQTRICVDLNACGTTAYKPAENQSCSYTPPSSTCTENWSCTGWTACSAGGTQARTCVDLNACGTTTDQPVASNACIPPPPPPTSPQSVPTSPPPTEPPTVAPPPAGPSGGVTREAYIAVGPANPGASQLRVYNDAGQLQLAFRPFGVTKRGLTVATGDIDGDGVNDLIVGQASGPNREVRVYGTNGRLKFRFLGLPAGIGSGLRVAAGDLNGDGRSDILVAPATGKSQLSAYSYSPSQGKFFLLGRFLAFSPRYTGGVSLAAGDVTDDSADEVLVAQGLNGNGIVRILRYDRTARKLVAVRQFQPFGTRFHQALAVAAGNVTGDAKDEIVVAPGPGTSPLVRVLSATGSRLKEFYALDRSFRGGLRVTTVDTDGDGTAEVLTGAYGAGTSDVRQFRLVNGRFVRVSSFAAFDRNYRNGLSLAAFTE